MQQAIGINYPVAAWRGIAGPKGLPADVDAKLIATIKKIADEQGMEGVRGAARATA